MLEVLSIAGVVLWLAVGVVVVVRLRGATGAARGRLMWLVWGELVTGAVASVAGALSLLVDWPARPFAGWAVAWALVPLSVLVGRSHRLVLAADRVVVHTVVVSGLVAMTGVVYLFVVLGLGRTPVGHERTILVLSIGAAAVASLFALPVRSGLEEWANQRVYGDRRSPDEALRTFGGRMSRSVPMDELLLQLVETLRSTMHLSVAEIWTGSDGQLTRSVSVPDRGPARLELRADELSVVARAHAQGNAWLQVWAPQLLEGRDGRLVRSVSVAHLGQLLGLIVLERPADEAPFSEDEDRVLVELSRQVGLALHNVRLDSALQASLEQLRERNAELVASRARIVAAADESRRQIERNLHDGAQQHLVALAVKVGLISTLMGSDPETANSLLEQLRGDVQATLSELRELAHGIYPPLLRDRGLSEALRAVANRAALPTTVEVLDGARYDSEVEAAVYFCCLEAVQNAGKHAGAGARIAVTVGHDGDVLWFEIVDDGAGFELGSGGHGQGFVNMRDRLGALGGELTVRSAPGEGSTVRGEIPLRAD
jgi:signal transduction histidine kinase